MPTKQLLAMDPTDGYTTPRATSSSEVPQAPKKVKKTNTRSLCVRANTTFPKI